MSSQVTSILQRHAENTSLTLTAPPPMMAHRNDAGADDITAPLDERIIAGAVEALEAGQTHYVDVPGIGPLREQLAHYLSAQTNAVLGKPNLLVTAGMQESRFLTIQMIGDPFGRVAVPEVVHPGVKQAIGVRSLVVDTIPVEREAGYLPTPEGIRAVLAAGSRLLYLESPSRLTGAIFDAATVADIAKLVIEFEATVIWDQGLHVWVGGGAYPSLLAQPDLSNRTAAIGEVYPGAGLASWHIGYIAAPEAWIAPMQSQKQIMAICTSTATQYAALEAGRLYAEAHPIRAQMVMSKRQALTSMATGAGLTVVPGQASNVLALHLSPEQMSKGMAALAQDGYGITTGSGFGAPEIVRLTVTPTVAVDEALQRLIRA